MAYGVILNQTPQIDLSNYVTQEQFSTAISNLNSAVANINGPMTVYSGNGTYTFTAQNAGLYKVYAVSKGGDGGDGHNGSGTNYIISSTGGGSGAVAIFQLNLQENETINISITTSEVNINNGQVILTNGGNGQDGQNSNSATTSLPGGIGGTVSSTINLLFSVQGQSAPNSIVYNSEYNKFFEGGKGAPLSAVMLYPAIYGGKLAAFVNKGKDGSVPYYVSGTETTYGSSAYSGYTGAGGDGGSSCAGYQGGAEGGPAAVIIEYLGNIT